MNNKARGLRVVKVGGSLLQNPRLAECLNRFLANHTEFTHLVMVGGGKSVDCLRDWQAIHELPDEYCHWAAIRMMSETARLLNQICPELPIVDSPFQPLGNSIFEGGAFFGNRSTLSKDWNTTSDSMAAEVAEAISADELWLFKSSLPASSNMKDWQSANFVDANFLACIQATPRVFVADITRASQSNETDLLSVQGI